MQHLKQQILHSPKIPFISLSQLMIGNKNSSCFTVGQITPPNTSNILPLAKLEISRSSTDTGRGQMDNQAVKINYLESCIMTLLYIFKISLNSTSLARDHSGAEHKPSPYSLSRVSPCCSVLSWINPFWKHARCEIGQKINFLGLPKYKKF